MTRIWIMVAAAFIFATAARAQMGGAHTHLIPLPHPEIIHPNDPNLPPSVLHPHVFHARPPHLQRHQHLIPLPHPELVHPRRQASFGTFRYSSSGLVMTETLLADAGQTSSSPPATPPEVIDSPREIAPRIAACWKPPPLGEDAAHQITMRMEFARDGSIFGEPRVTHVDAGSGDGARQALEDSIRAALRQCTPLHFGRSFGANMAGYPIIIHFISSRDDTYNPQD